MRDYSLNHLSDSVLLRDLVSLAMRDRETTAALLAHLAEVDVRRLYIPLGYSSMHAYCVEELRLSEDAAYKRIRAARAARQFPVLFDALADGRLHLAAISVLAPHLTAENVEELIAAATHRRKSEVEEILARRFAAPREIPVRVQAVPSVAPSELAPGRVGSELPLDPDPNQLAPGRVESGTDASPTTERFFLQLTISRSTKEKLRHAQALLSHAVPAGDMAQVLDRALDSLIKELEKQKLGAGSARAVRHHGSGRSGPARSRYIPAQVRRAVWERDQGQCTFVGTNGRRCRERRFLQFDHVEPFARGGKATVEGLRLRCRAHNQYEAERVFGAEFMSRKREGARSWKPEGATCPRRKTEAQAARAAAREQTQDVLAGLRALGCRPNDARRAAEFSETVHAATLEERMRAALAYIGGRAIGSSPIGAAQRNGPP